MDRNLALEMVRVTEAAALAAGRWVGKDDKVSAEQAAAEAMHRTLNSISFNGKIVIGRGDQKHFSVLYDGEDVGTGSGNQVDIVLDPMECQNSVAFGRTNAMSVIALAAKGEFFVPPVTYMEKIAVGAEAASAINLALPVEENLELIASAKNYSVSDMTVVVLHRDRHRDIIERIRAAGARLHLIPDGDISAAIAAGLHGTGIDLLIGTGGATAGILAAAALRCIGGEMQIRLAPRDENERDLILSSGNGPINRLYRTVDLVRGNSVMVAATGITDGDTLNGVRYRANGATSHSLVMRLSSRTRRFIVTEHYFTDNPNY